MEFSTEYTDVAIIIQLDDVFVVVVDDDDDKVRHIIMIGQDTDDSKGFFFSQVNLQCEHDEKTLFVFITNFL